MTAESPVIEREIERIRRLEHARVISWVTAEQLIENVHQAYDPYDPPAEAGDPPAPEPGVFQLGRLRLLDLQARYLAAYRTHVTSEIVPLGMSREKLVAALLERELWGPRCGRCSIPMTRAGTTG